MNERVDSPSPGTLMVRGHRPDLGNLILGCVFVGFLIQQALVMKSLEKGFLFLLGWILIVQFFTIVAWLRPPWLELRAGQLRLRVLAAQPTMQTAVSNIAALGVLDKAMLVRFHDLNLVSNLSSGARGVCETNMKRSGCHLIVRGERFDREQINELREAMGFPIQLMSQGEAATQTFINRLIDLTPRTWVTTTLLIANIAVFGLMQTQEVGIWQPSPESLLAWGANYGPRTIPHEWWRLFTHQFLHIGILHLLFNMSVLRRIGPTAERLLGSESFLIGYIFSGVCGGLCSLWWSSAQISAGASGAIFGVFGMILGMLARHHRTLPMEMVKQHRDSIVIFVLFNVYFSFTLEGIDVGAHLGGLAGGFLYGLAIVPVYLLKSSRSRYLQLIPVTACCALIGTAGIRQLPPSADLPTALQQVFRAESDAQRSFEAVLKLAQRGELTSAETGKELRLQVVEPWHAARLEFDSQKNISAAQRGQFQVVSEYMKMKEEAWQLYALAMEKNDWAKLGDAALATEAAWQSLREWSAANPKAGFTVPPDAPQLATELAVFVSRDRRVTARWRLSVESHASGKISDGELARRIERDFLPALRDARERFQKNAKYASGNDPTLCALLIRYADTRVRSWVAQVEALNHPSPEATEQQQQLGATADELERQLARSLSETVESTLEPDPMPEPEASK